MPHAVITGGNLDLARIHRDLEPWQLREGDTLLKVGDSFLSRRGTPLLLEALVIEGTQRRFLIEIDGREGSLTVRLYGLTDPEKTPGVRRLVAEVAKRICALAPEARVTRTNLAPFMSAG